MSRHDLRRLQLLDWKIITSEYEVKMSKSELQNFVNKFHQLRQAGYTAHLNVDAKAGQSWVSLCVMLGSGPVKRPKHRSPSYLQRQERRKAAQLAAENSSRESDAEKASEAQITEEVLMRIQKMLTMEVMRLKKSTLMSINVKCVISLAIRNLD